MGGELSKRFQYVMYMTYITFMTYYIILFDIYNIYLYMDIYINVYIYKFTYICRHYPPKCRLNTIKIIASFVIFYQILIN